MYMYIYIIYIYMIYYNIFNKSFKCKYGNSICALFKQVFAFYVLKTSLKMIFSKHALIRIACDKDSSSFCEVNGRRIKIYLSQDALHFRLTAPKLSFLLTIQARKKASEEATDIILVRQAYTTNHLQIFFFQNLNWY